MAIQWELLIFSLMLGIASGTFVFIGIGEIKGMFKSTRMTAALISLVTIAIGGLASFFHLGHPERIFHILGNVSSGIAQELIFTSIMGLIVVVYIFLLKKGTSDSARKAVGIVGAVFSLIMPLSTAKIYLLPSRPAWDTLSLPLLYLAAALAMGMFLMWLVTLKKEDTQSAQLVNKMAIFAQSFFAGMVVIYLICIAMAPYPHASRSVMRLLTGDLAIMFWLGVVAIGLLLPLFVAFKGLKQSQGASGSISLSADGAATGLTAADSAKQFNLIAAGVCCTLIGSVVIRMLMYLMGSSIEQFFL